MSITVVVADDEQIARKRIARLVEETREAAVLATCAGGRETVEAVRAQRPQLLFLDVQMPDMDGFAVIEALGLDELPPTVFVTAFDEYAVKAFDLHAIDYLLKPYDPARFAEAFSRAKRRLAEPHFEDEGRLRALLEDYLTTRPRETGPKGLDRIAIKADGVLKIVRTIDVDWWETEGNYVRAYVGPKSHLIRMTAAKLERQLDPRQFVRIHRRYFVNIDRIAQIQPWFAGDAVIILNSGAKLRMSRSFRERLHGRLLGDAE